MKLIIFSLKRSSFFLSYLMGAEMSKTWSGLGRSLFRRLHCRSFIGLAAFLILPFCVFGLSSDDFEPPSIVRVYVFTGFSSLANYTISHTSINSYGDPYSVYINNPFGISFNSAGTINIPKPTGSLTNSSVGVDFPIRHLLS